MRNIQRKKGGSKFEYDMNARKAYDLIVKRINDIKKDKNLSPDYLTSAP